MTEPSGDQPTSPMLAPFADTSTAMMKRRAIYAFDTFKQSWLMSFAQFFPLCGAWIASLAGPVFLLAMGVLFGALIDNMVFHTHGPGFITFLGTVIPGLLIGWLWGGWIYISLKVARGLPVHFGDLFRPAQQIVSTFILLIISTTLIGLGTMIFVLPGAFLFLKWQLAPYYVVDRNYGPIQALKQSWNDTNVLLLPLAILDLMFVGLQTVTSATIVGPFLCHIALAVATAIVYNVWLTDEKNPEYPQIEG